MTAVCKKTIHNFKKYTEYEFKIKQNVYLVKYSVNNFWYALYKREFDIIFFNIKELRKEKLCKLK